MHATTSPRESSVRARASQPDITHWNDCLPLSLDRDSWGDYRLDAEPPVPPDTVGGTPATSDPMPSGELLPVVQEVSRLALALSEASYRQGLLEADLRHAQGEADRLRREAAQAKAEAADLRQRLAAVRDLPWWRRLLG